MRFLEDEKEDSEAGKDNAPSKRVFGNLYELLFEEEGPTVHQTKYCAATRHGRG